MSDHDREAGYVEEARFSDETPEWGHVQEGYAPSDGFATQPIEAGYVGEDSGASSFPEGTIRGRLQPDDPAFTTLYGADETASVHAARVDEGLLVDEQGQPFNGRFGYVLDPHTGILHLFDPEEAWVSFKGEWIDVSNLGAEKWPLVQHLLQSGEQVSTVHHSTAVRGGEIAGAGMIQIADGAVVTIDNSSGHYKPAAELMAQTMEWLYAQGMNVSAIQLNDIGHRSAEEILASWNRATGSEASAELMESAHAEAERIAEQVAGGYAGAPRILEDSEQDDSRVENSNM